MWGYVAVVLLVGVAVAAFLHKDKLEEVWSKIVLKWEALKAKFKKKD
jgi:hypothetical protein